MGAAGTRRAPAGNTPKHSLAKQTIGVWRTRVKPQTPARTQVQGLSGPHACLFPTDVALLIVRAGSCSENFLGKRSLSILEAGRR